MKIRRLPGLFLLLSAMLLSAFNLFTMWEVYPSLPASLSTGLGKPIALFVPIFSAVIWLLLLLAYFRSGRLILPFPFREDAMKQAREALADVLAALSLISSAGFFAAERALLKGQAISGWLYALIFVLFLLAAAYFAYACLRIAKKHGVMEKEISEAEAEAAWESFVKERNKENK